jgi:hypothetical protein
MGDGIDATQSARQREGLITLTAMHYIEEHGLLDGAQLNEAKQSLRAMFLRTSGAETMLRRLIEVLKVRRDMHGTFSRISSTFVAIRRSIESMEERGFNLRPVSVVLDTVPSKDERFREGAAEISNRARTGSTRESGLAHRPGVARAPAQPTDRKQPGAGEQYGRDAHREGADDVDQLRRGGGGDARRDAASARDRGGGADTATNDPCHVPGGDGPGEAR